MLHAVIMAGGSGTRFWPQSRESFPKQFLTMKGDRSLLQATVDRIRPLIPIERIVIVTNERQMTPTLEQVPELQGENIIGEPLGRDTAACICLAAELIRRRDPDARLIVLAADHLIEPVEMFQAAVATADRFLAEHPDAIITFGIKPTFAATAYGYLSRDTSTPPDDVAGMSVHRLSSFHEKPKPEVAEQFFASGRHYWNSGIFGWTAETIVGEIRSYLPETAAACDRIVAAWNTPQRAEVFRKEYEALDKISIDFAVMEKTKKPIHMIVAPFAWDDVGSWLALERLHARDEAGNVSLGRHVGIESNGCIVVAKDKHVVATLGVEHLIIVQTPDATLVADRRQEQSIKNLLQLLRERGWLEYL